MLRNFMRLLLSLGPFRCILISARTHAHTHTHFASFRAPSNRCRHRKYSAARAHTVTRTTVKRTRAHTYMLETFVETYSQRELQRLCFAFSPMKQLWQALRLEPKPPIAMPAVRKVDGLCHGMAPRPFRDISGSVEYHLHASCTSVH